MLLEKHRTSILNNVQQERIEYSLSELESNIEDLSKTIAEARRDILCVLGQLTSLREHFHETE